MRFTFPHYLFPSFLIRHNSPDPDDSNVPSQHSRSGVDHTAANSSFAYLCCKGCHAPLTKSAIISKGFAGRHGRGYLCHDVINADLGGIQERNLLTGLHTVRDLNCAVCHLSLGWKYCTAREPSQRYKMGKFLLEARHVVKLSHWPDSLAERDENAQKKDYLESKWDTQSIDLDTLTDEESRPATPMLGKQVQGNIFYDDIEDLMLGWADGNQRRRV